MNFKELGILILIILFINRASNGKLIEALTISENEQVIEALKQVESEKGKYSDFITKLKVKGIDTTKFTLKVFIKLVELLISDKLTPEMINTMI